MNMYATEREELRNAVDMLPDAALGKLANYMAFLRYEEWLEEQEDLEDIAAIKARKDEKTIPMSEVLKEYEAKYGPLDRV